MHMRGTGQHWRYLRGISLGSLEVCSSRVNHQNAPPPMYVTKSAKLWTHAFSCSPSASLDSWDREKSRSMSLATVAGLLAFLCFVRCAIGWLKLRGAITERHTARGSGQAKKEAPSKEAESKKDYGILYLEVWSGCPFRLAICISICFTKLQILSLEDIMYTLKLERR